MAFEKQTTVQKFEVGKIFEMFSTFLKLTKAAFMRLLFHSFYILNVISSCDS